MSEANPRIRIPRSRDNADFELLTQGKVLIISEINEDTYKSFFEHMLSLETAGSPDIELRINSEGGSATYGLIMYDIIRLYKGKVTGVVVGQATSMASLILQACTVRKISQHSWVHIHTAQTINPVSFTDIINPRKVKKLQATLKDYTDRAVDIYMLRAKVTRKRMAEAMVKDEAMTPREALRLGLVDEII